MIEKNKDVHKHCEKTTCMLHALCSMLLMLHYFLKFRETLVFSFFYARILLLLGHYYYYYYYLRESCMHICKVVCICIQVSRKGERGSS